MSHDLAPPAGGEPELQRTLGFWQVALYGLGSMLGAGIYALIGKAAVGLGSAVWLAFLAAMIGAALTGLSYACAGSRYPRAGGASYVTHRAFGRAPLSYVVGIAVTMSGLTSMATGSQAIAENLKKGLGWVVDTKLLAIVLVFLIGCLIYRGIRQCMWVNILCTIVEASGLLFIIAVGMKHWGTVNYLEFPPAAEDAGGGAILMLVLSGALVTFFSFIGFEDILNVSEEVKDPQKNVPRGLLAAMAGATVIYMAVAITAVSVIPWQELSASPTPLMDVARRAAPWFTGIGSVYLVITIFAIGNTALLNYLMGSRLLYGMARQGVLPSVLGRVNAKRHTPHVAIVTLFFIVSSLILIGGVKQLAEATVLLLLTVFTLVNLSLIRLKRRDGEPAGGFEVPVLVPLFGAVVCATLMCASAVKAVQGADKESQKAPLISLGILGAALLLYRALKPKTNAIEGM